jgi:hypothetical protein
VIVLLPAVIYALFFLCNKDYCLTTDKLLSLSEEKFDFDALKDSLPAVEGLLSDSASHAVLGWMAFHSVLERVLPGEVAYGTQLVTGERLTYYISGHLQFWVTLLVICFGSVNFTYDSEGMFRVFISVCLLSVCLGVE